MSRDRRARSAAILPADVWLQILAVLRWPERLQLRVVCRAWRDWRVPIRTCSVWNPRRDVDLEDLGIAPQAIEDLEIVLGRRLVSCRSRSSARLTRLKRLRIAVTDVGGDHGNWASVALDAGPELEFDLEFVACSVLALTLPRDVQRRVTILRLRNTLLRSHESYWFSGVRTVVFKKVNGDLNACDLARVLPLVASLTLDDCPDTSSLAFLSGFAFLEALTVANTRSELLVTVPEDVKSKVTTLKLEYLWNEPKSLLDWPALLELQTSGSMPRMRTDTLRVLRLDVTTVPVPAVHFASLESLTLTALGRTFGSCFRATATGLRHLRLALFKEDAALRDFMRVQTRLVTLHLSWIEQGEGPDEGLGAHLVPATVRELSCMALKAADVPQFRERLMVLTVKHDAARLRRLLPHTLIRQL